MKKYSSKALEKRKEERKGFPEFFQRHIQNIRENNLCCKECGDRLKGDVSEIAHILPKSIFKSVSTNDKNVIYLCGMWSNNQCHSNYDNFSVEKVRQMNIFPHIVDSFKELENEVIEKINYKTEERYTWLV